MVTVTILLNLVDNKLCRYNSLILKDKKKWHGHTKSLMLKQIISLTY